MEYGQYDGDLASATHRAYQPPPPPPAWPGAVKVIVGTSLSNYKYVGESDPDGSDVES